MNGCINNFYIIYKTKNCEPIAMRNTDEVREFISAHKEYELYDVYDKCFDTLCPPKDCEFMARI